MTREVEDKEMNTYECDYCGQSDPDVAYTIRKPYEHEPASVVCEDCMEEQPWK